uniref:Tetratricopeptide repeat protein n=1 Tax=Laticauda laticaudata TaxID=8630 RepID=A0A8C5SNR8_LATLA
MFLLKFLKTQYLRIPNQKRDQTEENISIELENKVVRNKEEKMKLDHNKGSQEIIDKNVETDEKWKQTNENKKAALDAMEKGEYQKASELFTKAIKLNPHFTNLYVCRASAFLKLHMPIAAVKDCNNAIKLNPNMALPYKYRGEAFCMLGYWQEATKDFSKIMKWWE